MSGGVDSSVAALLLKRAGVDFIGVSMHLWEGPDAFAGRAAPRSACCGVDDIDDARRVAAAIGIPYYVVNLKDGTVAHWRDGDMPIQYYVNPDGSGLGSGV